MSDMAFGGGSELLEAGHDQGNVWALLEEAMLYVALRHSDMLCADACAKHRDVLRARAVARDVLWQDPSRDREPRRPPERLRRAHGRTPEARVGEEGPLPLPRTPTFLV